MLSLLPIAMLLIVSMAGVEATHPRYFSSHSSWRVYPSLINPNWRVSTNETTTELERFRAKQKGPNVCAERIPFSHWKQCSYKGPQAECKLTTYRRTVFACCDGFEMVPYKMGCPRALYQSNKTITTVLKDLELNTFLHAIDVTGLKERIQNSNSTYTIFAPSEEAFTELDKAGLKYLLHPEDLSKILLHHMSEGVTKLEDIKDEEDIPSLLSPYGIRTTKYSNGKFVFAQGARLITTDTPFKNGIIHVIDKVMKVPSSLAEKVLGKRWDLKRFNAIVYDTGTSLSPINTIIAPTNAAFDNMSAILRDKIFDNPVCLKNLLLNHLLRFTVYSGVVSDGNTAYATTLAGNRMEFTLQKNGTFSVGTSTAIDRDLGGVDRIVHVIDTVQVPTSALGLVNLANSQGATRFVKLLKKSGLNKAISSYDGSMDFTVFAPSNEAFEKLTPAQMARFNEPGFLEQYLRYHVMTGVVLTPDMTDGMKTETLSSRFGEVLFSQANDGKSVLINGVPIHNKRSDISACNGLIHIIDKVLPIPEYNMLALIQSNASLSMFAAMIKKANLSSLFQDSSHPITVFAPSNKALQQKGIDIGNMSVSALRDLLRSHVMSGTKFTGQFPRRYSLSSLIRRDGLVMTKQGNVVAVNGAKVSVPDLIATNGVLHILGNSIMTSRLPSRVNMRPISSFHIWKASSDRHA